MDVATVARLVDAHGRSRDRLRTRIVGAVRRAFSRFDGWYSPALIEEVADEVAAIVASGQRSVAALTDAYLSRVASEVAERAIPPVGPIRRVDTLRGGIAPREVWGRPVKEFRYQRHALGAAVDVARDAALLRAERIADEDLGLAQRHQTREFNVVRRVDGFRRIVRPEFSRTGTCGICYVAADRVYRRDDLLPIHTGCNCGVLPILNGRDPGLTINSDDLRRIYETAGGTDKARLQRLRIETSEHGELGPVLHDRSHRFRGPDDVAADVAA